MRGGERKEWSWSVLGRGLRAETVEGRRKDRARMSRKSRGMKDESSQAGYQRKEAEMSS